MTPTLWSREQLEKLVADLQAENANLREQVREMKEQVHGLLVAYRAEVVKNASREPVRKIRGKWLERMDV